jgi:protein-disulfide isomerase
VSKTRWIIFAVVALGIFGSLIWFSESSKINVDDIDQMALQPSADINEQPMGINGNIGDHFRGNKDSVVTLVEYGDFQCPSCRNAHGVLEPILNDYQDHILFIYRNWPITQIHPNAKAAAASAEAAAFQGKYWEYHSALFQNQGEWSNVNASQRMDLFVRYGEALGLDIEKFREDIASPNINQKIKFDTALAIKAGGQGTPTMLLNGELLDGTIWGNEMAFREKLNELLTEKGITPPALPVVE